MKIILTRHGETVENVKRISQGQTHGTLTENGIGQAKKLALRLKDEKIDAIYSSDLDRAKDTAKEIAKHHPHIDIVFTKLLKERNLGEFTGKHCDEVDWYNKTGKLETGEQMKKRAKKAIDDAYEKHKDGTVVFIGHGGINAALVGVVMNKSYVESFLMEDWKNTNVTIFEIYEDKKHKIHCLNCTKHLEQNT